MAESTTHFTSELRKIERSTAAVSAKVQKLLTHFGIPDVTDEEVDRALFADNESPAAQRERGARP